MGRRSDYEYDTAYYRNRAREIHLKSPNLTNRQIGQLLGVSGQTIANYLKRRSCRVQP